LLFKHNWGIFFSGLKVIQTLLPSRSLSPLPMPREISAGAVIFRRTRSGPEFLILHYGLGHWDFVKGNIEKGEEEKETVKREIEEETGITRVRFVDGFRETIKYFYRWKGEGIFKIVIYYLVETKQKKVKLSYEHIGSDWMRFEKGVKTLTYSNSKNILKRAMRYLED
jgi:bis(5'-nucleosidyl)-tetraphosphatase